MAGPELHANAINTARKPGPLRTTAGIWTIVAVLLFSALPSLIAFRYRALIVFGIVLPVFLLYLGAAQFAFSHGRILPIAYPTVALIVALFGTVGLVRSRGG